MPKQLFLRCVAVLFLFCLPSVLHAQACDNGFCFEIAGSFAPGVVDHVDAFLISADKPVVELHLSINELYIFGELTRWSPSFPPPELSPSPDISSTLDFNNDSMTYDVLFSPSAPLPAGTYEVAFLHAPEYSHNPYWSSSGRFSDGSSFNTFDFVVPEPSTLTLGSIAMLFFLGFGWRRRRRIA